MKSKTVIDPINPAIMDLPIWQELRTFVTPIHNSDKSRASIHLRVLPPGLQRRAKKIFVKCGHPNCDKQICIIRKHAGSSTYSVHPTGPRDEGHDRCAYGKYVQAQMLALQLDVEQAEQSPRIKRVKEDRRQQRLGIKMTKDGPEFILG